jgi:hypothetical protein
MCAYAKGCRVRHERFSSVQRCQVRLEDFSERSKPVPGRGLQRVRFYVEFTERLAEPSNLPGTNTASRIHSALGGELSSQKGKEVEPRQALAEACYSSVKAARAWWLGRRCTELLAVDFRPGSIPAGKNANDIHGAYPQRRSQSTGQLSASDGESSNTAREPGQSVCALDGTTPQGRDSRIAPREET